ncbi:MAG: DUF3365 domain-containing protein [Gammaproteobacteria bacterium]|nr:DUF3365 domain-containing protein [Gammaproteobacteria bacterium]
MKKILFSMTLSLILMSPIFAVTDSDLKQMNQESRQIVQNFAKNLKGELKAAMKKGGPVNAIQVCNEKALEITSNESKISGVTLSRTSLKIRNSKNKPEAWEKDVLQQFAERKMKGESPKKMEFREIVELNGKKQFRYMKAMGISQPCLHCHGEKALPDVNDKLLKLYPDDKARGYKLGDIRGAIVLIKDLK